MFGSCIIHILYTACAKIKKIYSSAKRLILVRNIRNKPLALTVTQLFELFRKLSSVNQNNFTAKLTERLADIISKVKGRTNAEHSRIQDKLYGKRYSIFDIYQNATKI